MRKIATFIAASTIATLSHSAPTWQFVVSRGGSSAYFDPSSVRWDGKTARLNVLSNSTNPTSLRIGQMRVSKLSIQYDVSYDCSSRSFYTHQTTWFDKPYATGTGHVSRGAATGQWFSPGSKVYEVSMLVDVLNVVCR